MVNVAAIQAIRQKSERITMPMLMSAMDDVMMGTFVYLFSVSQTPLYLLFTYTF